MKKIFLSLLMCAAFGTAFAQMTPEEKAALKAAQKEAKTQMSQGIKLRDEIELLLSANKTELEKGQKANQSVIDKNNDQIKEKALLAVDVLRKSIGSGNLAEKQLFDANSALFRAGGILFSPELNRIIAKQPADTIAMAKGLDAFSEGCYGIEQYGNPKNVNHEAPLKEAKAVRSKMIEYYSYVAIFYMQNQNLEGSIEAFDKYAGFTQKYPKWAGEETVKNPKTPISQLAFNLYYIGFNQKKYDVCEKYYEQALQYDDESSTDFVVNSHPVIYLQQGDTAKWVDASVKLISEYPNKPYAEIATQNLLAYFSKKGAKEMGEFADKVLAANPNNKMGNYGKGHSLFAQEKYIEALPFFKKTVEVDPEYLEGYNMCGMALYRQAGDNYYKNIDGKKFKTTAELKAAEEKQVKNLYREAATYFETCREKASDKPDLWAGPLQIIYKNLGEKAKADELDVYTK